MKITEALAAADGPLISLEILPPERGKRIDDLLSNVELLLDYHPAFINVTQHQPRMRYEESAGSIRRIRENKKPGTVAVSASINQRFGIETVPHVICGGLNKYQLEDILIDLEYLGLENIFAVRGDPQRGERSFIPENEGFSNASEMVEQITAMNRGEYVHPVRYASRSNFCVGVAGYPEKHYEALNLKTDMEYLKKKVDAGAEYIITQLFFSAEAYIRFVDAARKAGITVPIIPGLKPVVRAKSLMAIPRTFFIDIPESFAKAMEAARTPKEEREIGLDHMAKLIGELIDYGIPCLHLFTLGQGKSARALLGRVFGPK